MDRQWNDKIFSLEPAQFNDLALEIFDYQYYNNILYKAYCDALGRVPQTLQGQQKGQPVRSVTSIPFLPIRFFKSHAISTTEFEPDVVFESSGTTGMINSRHLVRDTKLYETSFIKGFERVYGPVKDLVIIGLLPSYLERSNSSLVYMVDKLIALSEKTESGFYLHDIEQLASRLAELESRGQRTLLIGVTFALLDFAEAFPMRLEHTMIMETGGMKGRRKEMVRQEVQDILKSAFALPVIHSEYGMTELLSQAYSTGDGIFATPPWMRILARDEEDPMNVTDHSQPLKSPGSMMGDDSAQPLNTLTTDTAHAGWRSAAPMEQDDARTISAAVNVIDLANVYSCSFIATDDAAKFYSDGRFEILGRLDNSDLRGCSLLTI